VWHDHAAVICICSYTPTCCALLDWALVAGHIYVANREAHQVVKFTPGGELVSTHNRIRAQHVHIETVQAQLYPFCISKLNHIQAGAVKLHTANAVSSYAYDLVFLSFFQRNTLTDH